MTDTPSEAAGEPLPDLLTAEFLSVLRHELRTPVNHIIGYSELLLEQVAQDSQDSFTLDLNRINIAGRRLLDLISDIFDLNKIQEGTMDLAWMRHELRTPLNQIIGYGELLQEEAEDLGREELIADLQKITGAAKRLLELINQSLSAVTLESDAPIGDAPPGTPAATGTAPAGDAQPPGPDPDCG